MQRRDFLKAGAAGMALTLAQGPARAQVEPRADVKGADAKDTPKISASSSSAGTVRFPPNRWSTNISPRTRMFGTTCPNLPEFSQDLEFLDTDPRIRLAKSTKDILANKAAGKISMVIGWQDSAALEEENGNDWRFSRPPKTKLREYYELGLRTANLAYQISNQFGGGLLDPEARLTSQGKYIIGKMQDLGILVDVCGHTGVQTALDVIAMARRPVVITHGTCRALNDNPRGSPDKVIEGVARTGGLMGIAAIDAFLTWEVKDAAGVDTGLRPPRATVARYVDEFDHLKRLVGIDYIGFGTDFTTDVENADPSQLFENSSGDDVQGGA